MTSISPGKRRRSMPSLLVVLLALCPLPALAQLQITGMMEDVDIVGPAHIVPTAGVDGGKLSGLITSEGIIKGEIELGPVTLISGGRVAGDIRGTANSPARIEAEILPGTRLENVIILDGSALDASVELGYNVRFETQESIPPGIDLGATLGFTPWRTGDRRDVPRLDQGLRARLDGPALPTILDDIASLPEFTSTQVSQNANGELLLSYGGPRSVLLPARVTQATEDDVPGIAIMGDGGLRFTTEWQVVIAYPIPAQAHLLGTALAKQNLNYRHGAAPQLTIVPAQTWSTHSFSARAAATIVPVGGDVPLGLTQTPQPGLAGVARISLVFVDPATQESLMQEFPPWPVDWPALRDYLLDTVGADTAAIADDGSISVAIGDMAIRVMPAYAVSADSMPGAALTLRQVDDMNGDGTPDYRVTYTTGGSQILYRFPSR